MRSVKDPRQTGLFDPFQQILDPRAYERLVRGWHGVFRHIILETLSEPVERLGEQFCADNGAPTKELFSMAGLLLCKEFMNWTTTEAVEAYMFDASIQYALNLEPCGQHVTERTLERYAKRVVEGGLAGAVFDAVTSRLVAELDLRVERQRLDSTHVLSNMATFGRTRLMGVTIKRFLVQVKRHGPEAWEGLPSPLRERYMKSDRRLFGDVKSSEGRQRLRQQVAEDMHFLVEGFADDPETARRRTYKKLVQVFEEQCDVVRPKTEVEGGARAEPIVEVKKHTGGDVIQNPSDPEATCDGHKGPGYKVQLAETCDGDNEVQLLTAALPQTAVESDARSLEPVLEALKEASRKPEELLADGAYGSGANDQKCREEGIELVSPAQTGVSKDADPKANRLAEFEIDPATGEVIRCPAGHAPESSRYDPETDKTHVSMSAHVCEGCALRAECPVQAHRNRYIAHFTSKRRRLAGRRRYQETEEFRRRYALRAGLEATNSALKRRTGLDRVRVRGGPRVFYGILMKCAGWNVLRAAASEKLRAKVAQMARDRVLSRLLRRLHGLLLGCFGSSRSRSGVPAPPRAINGAPALARPLAAA